jgi:hypothetical protein
MHDSKDMPASRGKKEESDRSTVTYKLVMYNMYIIVRRIGKDSPRAHVHDTSTTESRL